MISDLLHKIAREYPDRLFLIDDRTRSSYKDVAQRVTRVAKSLRAKGVSRLYIYAADSIELVVFLLATDHLGIEVCVVSRQFTQEEVIDVMERVGPGTLITDASPKDFGITKVLAVSDLYQDTRSLADLDPSSKRRGGWIIILTTGTTGKPKGAAYTWERLVAQGRSADTPVDATWLLVYPLNHFAGIQMLLHVLRNMCTMVIPASRDLDHFLETMQWNKVDSVSATPTFWRMFAGKLTDEQAEDLQLKQITLGGEASTPDVLVKLRTYFPEASISQVYAITEMGSCFSVKDGEPGFPVSFLHRPVGNVELKIVDGELYVKSDKRMIGYVDGTREPHHVGDWYATGDLVEIVGDRVFFRGRKSEVINVGGVKVHPLKVEEAILGVEGVQAARVHGKHNPVTGQIVVAEVELEAGASEETVLNAIRRRCQSRLNRYERPRYVQVVSSLPKRNVKIVRR